MSEGIPEVHYLMGASVAQVHTPLFSALGTQLLSIPQSGESHILPACVRLSLNISSAVLSPMGRLSLAFAESMCIHESLCQYSSVSFVNSRDP